MAASFNRQPDDIDLRSLWQASVRSLPRVAALGAVMAALTFGVLALVAPRYMSEAQLAIESKSPANPFTDPSRSGASDSVSVRMDKEAINTHVRALMSTDLAETIVRDLKLADRPEFNSALGSPDKLSALLRLIGVGAPRASETDQDRALAAYFSRLEVYSPKESRFIGVRFTSTDPVLAAEVANRVAETYREGLANQSITETDDVQKALEPKIGKLADEAAAAEAEVEKFRGEANIFKGGQQATGLNEQQLGELNAELSRAKAARSEADARARQAADLKDLGSAETLPEVQKSPLIQNLVQSRVRVERQISELSATLLPAHPRMRQLAADLKGLKTQITAEVGKIVDGIGKEAKVAALREEAIEKSVAETKTRIVSAGPEEAKLRSLEADARSKRAELDRLRAQYESNRVRADDSRAIPVEAQIVSSARPSTEPVFPKKGPTALLVGFATVLIGLALVVTRGLLSGSRAPARRRRMRPMPERAIPVLTHPPREEPTRPAKPAPSATAPPPRIEQAKSPGPGAAPVAAGPEAASAPDDAPGVPPTGSAPPPFEPPPDDSEAKLEPRLEPKPAPSADAAPAGPPPEPAAVKSGPTVSGPAAAPAAPIKTARSESTMLAAVIPLASVEALGDRIEALRRNGVTGARTLLVGNTDVFTLAEAGEAIGRRLASKGLTVVMIDWSLNGTGIAEPLGAPSFPGFSELLEGTARFEDVVHALRDSDVQIIASGRALPASAHPLDGASLNFLLDALDNVYEHIVVVSRTDPGRRLFEAIEGRFDCGAVVLDGQEAPAAAAAAQGSFLGFEVEGIALFTVDTAGGKPRERAGIARAS